MIPADSYDDLLRSNIDLDVIKGYICAVRQYERVGALQMMFAMNLTGTVDKMFLLRLGLRSVDSKADMHVRLGNCVIRKDGKRTVMELTPAGRQVAYHVKGLSEQIVSLVWTPPVSRTVDCEDGWGRDGLCPYRRIRQMERACALQFLFVLYRMGGRAEMMTLVEGLDMDVSPSLTDVFLELGLVTEGRVDGRKVFTLTDRGMTAAEHVDAIVRACDLVVWSHGQKGRRRSFF